ncbi:Aca2/YdiL-like domain-containing protein [Nocardia asiatica]|uniref:Aca2/YdiL-like domain-containing protein n=1 Tax=Nocardia asiatica TaxID=209252 RepID=UPI003EE1222E
MILGRGFSDVSDLPGTGTAAGFRATRELLGLPVPWCARFFAVAERTVERWEKGAFQIPDSVARELAALADETEQVVEAMVDAMIPGRSHPACTLIEPTTITPNTSRTRDTPPPGIARCARAS